MIVLRASRANASQVNVYRNGENGSTPLPTLFGPIFGINSQGVRATATAIVGERQCYGLPRPIALADNWNEFSPPLTPTSTFMHYSEPGGAVLVNPDTYVAPSATQAGNTLYPTDLGERRIWNATAPHPSPRPSRDGLVLELDLGGGPTSFQQEPDNLHRADRRVGADTPGLLDANRVSRQPACFTCIRVPARIRP